MTVLIFDFDGTIADTLEAVVRIANRLAPIYGYSPATAERLQMLRDMGTREIVRQSEVPFYKMPFLLRRLRSELGREILSLVPIAGMDSTLHTLAARGCSMGILTSNSTSNVLKFLSNHRLTDCFDFIHTGSSLFGKHKALKQVLHRQRLPWDEVIYVGDETRDIEAAKQIGIQVAAVSWGFNTRAALAEHHPDFLLNCPQELLQFLDHEQATWAKALTL